MDAWGYNEKMPNYFGTKIIDETGLNIHSFFGWSFGEKAVFIGSDTNYNNLKNLIIEYNDSGTNKTIDISTLNNSSWEGLLSSKNILSINSSELNDFIYNNIDKEIKFNLYLKS